MHDVTRRIEIVVPDDQRRLLSRRLTGASGSDLSPTPDLVSAKYAETSDLLGVRLLIYADNTTGSGEEVDVVVWRYRRILMEDPLGVSREDGWSQGERISGIKLGYADVDANKEFEVPTQGAERVFFQVLGVPPSLAWMRTDIFTNVNRGGSLPSLALVMG